MYVIKLKTILIYAVAVALVAAALSLIPGRAEEGGEVQLPIIMYHSICDDGEKQSKFVISRGELEREKEETERLKREFETFKREKEAELDRRLKNAENESARMIEKAQTLLDGARATSEYVFAELDAAKKAADASKTADAKKDVRRRMREYDDKLNPIMEREDDGYVLPRPLKKGDNVIHRNLGVAGVLLDDPDKNGNVSVRLGAAKSRANIKDLKLVEDNNNQKKKDPQSTFKATVSRNFKPELDIRGMMGDDGCFMVDKYLDEANIAGIKSVTVIHGKGTGALRSAVWKFLKSDRRVKSFRAGQYGEGDYGVTVIELK